MNRFRSDFGLWSCSAGRAVWLLTVLIGLLFAPIVLPPAGLQTAQAAEVIDTAQLRPLDDRTRITLAAFRYNRVTRIYLGTATVANTSVEPLDAPLYLVVASIGPAGASVVGATGLTADGKPYYDLTPLLPGGKLAPGAASATLPLQMTSPAGSSIQLELHVYGPALPANRPPVADAGPDQTARMHQSVTLDGSRSHDLDGDPLTFDWSFLSWPAGSAALLSDPTVVNPSFTLDRFGDYEIALAVSDGLADSAPDAVRISTLNSPPVADAGPDQSAPVGATVSPSTAAAPATLEMFPNNFLIIFNFLLLLCYLDIAT